MPGMDEIFWSDDPQDRAPMTEAIEETEKLRDRVAELEAENKRLRELVNDFSKAYVDIQRKIINDPIYSELRREVDGG